MEDVDAISDILYSRDIVNKQKDIEDRARQDSYEDAKREAIKKGYAPPPPPQNIKEDNKEQITLAFILNLLDGILETPGRIIILTTNHPEKLDSALVRPGRIDLNIHFNRCSRETIVELVTKFYETIDETSKEWCDFLSKLGQLDEYMLTPAEVNKIIFNYYNEPNLAFSEIILDIQKNMAKCIKEEFVDSKLNRCDIISISNKEENNEIVENKLDKGMEKLYLSTRNFFKQLFGKENIKFVEEKMLLVQDTLLISKQNLEAIYISNRDSIINGLLEVEKTINTNRKNVLKSPDVLYEIHEDEDGKFIYVDLETLNMLNDNYTTNGLHQNHRNMLNDNIIKGEKDIEIYKTPPSANVIAFHNNSNFSGFNTNNFESVDGSNLSDNGSSLDEFFKPII